MSYRPMFWMIVGVGPKLYLRKYKTEEEAKLEADIMAKTCENGEFTVMASVATVKKSDVSWDMHHEDYSESPF